MKHYAILAATLLASTANAADQSAVVKSNIDYKSNGGYESNRTAERTTASGTKQTTESKVNVDVDSAGRIDKTVKTEAVTDPKGLLNKQKDTSESQVEEKVRGGYKQVTTRKHTDADGTNIVYKTTTDVDVDAAGNVTTTAKTEKTVDPKGLMNSTTTTSKSTSVNGKVVDSSKKVN